VLFVLRCGTTGTLLTRHLSRKRREFNMSARRIVGLALVAIGMVILLWGGIFWRDRDTVVDAGPLKVETSERKGVALPPVLGAATLIAGIILVLMPTRRRE
jgi:hypothetical protein